MGFDIGGAVNSACDWICNAPAVRSVVGNPILTALIISSLVAIFITAQYDQIKKASFRRRSRTYLYLFFLIAAAQFIHHYAVVQCGQRVAAHQGVREVFAGINASKGLGAAEAVPVLPWSPSAPVTGGGGVDPSADSGRPNSIRSDNIASDPLDFADVTVSSRPLPSSARRLSPAE